MAAEFDALVNRRKKSASPKAVARTGHIAGDEYNEAGEVFVLAAEAIVDPRAHGGTAELPEAGLHEKLRRRVIEVFGVYRLDEGNLIRHL